jgi:hypothetical protein
MDKDKAVIIGSCANCAERVMVQDGEVVHIEPRDTEFPKQCDPNLIHKQD